MRKVEIRSNGEVFDAAGCNGNAAHVGCWCKNVSCSTTCAAFAQVVMMKADQTQDLVAVCAAIPQQIPIGVIEEGKVAVAQPRGPVIVRG